MTRQHKDCLLYGELSIGLVILVETDNKYYLIENFVPLQGKVKLMIRVLELLSGRYI